MNQPWSDAGLCQLPWFHVPLRVPGQRGTSGLPGAAGQGLAPGPIPLPQPPAGQLGGRGAAPALGMGHLPGGRTEAGDMAPWVGPAQQVSWPRRAGLRGAGDQSRCGVAVAGADGPGGLMWGPGPWAGGGSPGKEVRTLRTLVPSGP